MPAGNGARKRFRRLELFNAAKTEVLVGAAAASEGKTGPGTN